MFAPFTRSDIGKYSLDVLRNKIRCGLPSCPVCNTQPAFFRRHQARPRKFRILCDTLVQVVICLVIRWKCPGCKKTFTEQPPFALPFKRYTSDTILDRSGRYLEDETLTYRKTVLEEGLEIFHASTDDGNTPVDKALSHSTPYRWIATLGGFRETLRRALDIILQKNPATEVCRDLNVISEKDARVNDPLYRMIPSSTPAPFDQKPMFQQYGEEDQVFEIDFNGGKHKVIIRASWATLETLPDDGTDRGAKDYGKHAAKNIGVSIIRADRELVLDPSLAIGYDPVERWWGIEVDFPPELDEIFGVTNNKQAATIFSHMGNFDWKSEAEPGETFTDFKRRLAEDGDPRSPISSERQLTPYIDRTLLAIFL